MHPEKAKRRATIFCIGILVVYLGSYLALRTISLDDREWTGRPHAEEISFGIRASEIFDRPPETAAKESERRNRIDRRAQILGNLYRPLIWLDEKLTKIRIKLPEDEPDPI